MKLLQVDSSAQASSVTRRLTAEFAEAWRRNQPESVVVHRGSSGYSWHWRLSQPADTVMMGIRGWNDLDLAVLGSTSERVL